ncbi:three-helix bundle dimerization domain-containing protein [Mycolicibacterium sp. HS_4_1]
MSSTECLAPAGGTESSDDARAVPSATTSLRDWIAEVAGKLARREGRNDVARDGEIMGWCREAAMRFVDAPIQVFVPLLVERIVGDRIRRDRSKNGSAAAATDHAVRLQSCQLAS